MVEVCVRDEPVPKVPGRRVPKGTDRSLGVSEVRGGRREEETRRRRDAEAAKPEAVVSRVRAQMPEGDGDMRRERPQRPIERGLGPRHEPGAGDGALGPRSGQGRRGVRGEVGGKRGVMR